MGSSVPPTTTTSSSTSSSSTTSAHAHLKPSIKHISQAKILKKWRPLPASSQQKVREILLNLRTRRSGAGGQARIPPVGGKTRSKRASLGAETGAGRVSKNAIAEAEYDKVVEEVADKLLSRLPRMPFPPSSSSGTSTTATTAPSDFDLSSTLARTAVLQTQLSTNTHSARLLRRQIQREKAGLKRDKTELKMLEAGLRGSREVRRRKERGLHPLARLDGEEDSNEDEDEDAEERDGRKADGIARIAAIAGIGTSGSSSTASRLQSLHMASTSDPDSDDALPPLLDQLHSHLLSMRNNTASMTPVLRAMDEAKTALDKFSARRLDDEALRRLYGVVEV